MKKIAFIACLLLAGTSMAQRNKVEVNKQEGEKLENVNKTSPKKNELDKPAVTTGANSTTSHSTSKSGGSHAASRTSEEFQSSLDGVVRSEFGKTRSAAAAEAPKNDEEANARISELRSNSKSGIEKAEEKIEIARARLDELKASGDLSEDEYNSKMDELNEIEKRKDSLKSSMK